MAGVKSVFGAHAKTMPDGRVRVAMPTGKEAEEELRRIRRQERRRLRAAKMRGEVPEEGEAPAESAAPVEFNGIPSPEKMREDFWEAFYDLGGKSGLVAWGRRYPKEFYSVWARICVPKESGVAAPASLEGLLAQLGEDDSDEE